MKTWLRTLTVCLAAALCVAAASTVASAAAAATSLTGGDCGATSQPFAPWGDSNAYVLTTNGDFSAGSSGWTLSGGATITPGSGPLTVASSSGPQVVSTTGTTLLLPAGGSATSPSTCFGLETPNVRFFARSVSGSATIHVQLIATGLLGALSVLDGGTATVGPQWAPTPIFSTTFSQLGTLVGTNSIQIEITATGDVQLDELYIDPFCSH